MNNSIYNQYKDLLIDESKFLKKNNPNDKVYIRTRLNDLLDYYIKTLDNHHLNKCEISKNQYNLYSLWLTNLVCKIQPK